MPTPPGVTSTRYHRGCRVLGANALRRYQEDLGSSRHADIWLSSMTPDAEGRHGSQPGCTWTTLRTVSRLCRAIAPRGGRFDGSQSQEPGSPKVLLSLADLLWQTLCIVSACNNHSPLHQTYFPSRDEDLFQMLTFHHGLETCA